MASPSEHPAYSKEQINRYLKHIGLDTELKPALPTQETGETQAYLIKLQRHHLPTVPFENLCLHYSSHHTVSLDPDVLYEKIVVMGRGGYCMEVNCFFGIVLRSLGFDIYNGGARVNGDAVGQAGTGYLGWSHMVNFVTFANGAKYMIDVGFGGENPIQFMPLVANQVLPSIPPQEMRLMRKSMEGNIDSRQQLWFYQIRPTSEDEWKDIYSFTELEFLRADFEVMNFFKSQSSKSFFTQMALAMKMLQDQRGIYGQIILIGSDLKKKQGSKVEILKTDMTEADRVEALKTYFDIELDETEKRGIHGMVSQLK